MWRVEKREWHEKREQAKTTRNWRRREGKKTKDDVSIINSSDEIVRLSGNVIIINQNSKISGSKGITNLKTGKSNIIGDPKKKKRVKGIFSTIKKLKKGDKTE